VIVPPKGVVRRQSTSLAAHDDSEIAAALRFIFERACDGIRVDDVCDHLAISRRRLEIRFRRAVGRSPGDEIREVRMERARSLLTETEMNIDDIANRCGYRHFSSFAKAFRQHTGVRPGEYRRRTPS
jgi:LacI family transcriptional regulator